MSNVEHYFENLLYHGHDCKGEPNRKALPEGEQAAVEQCARYVKYTLFRSGVVRRKDCKYWDAEHGTGWCDQHSRLDDYGDWPMFGPYDFCNLGERKEQT